MQPSGAHLGHQSSCRYVSIHFLSPKIKGGTFLKQKTTISDWGFKVLPLHHNLTVSAVAGEGEQTRRESRAAAANGPIARTPSRSHWRNRVESTDRLSLSLRDIAFEISQAGEKTRRDYTRDLLAFLACFLWSAKFANPLLFCVLNSPSSPARALTPLTTFRTWGSEEMRSFSLGWATCPPSVEPGQGWEDYE